MRDGAAGRRPFPEHLRCYIDGRANTRVGAGPVTLIGPTTNVEIVAIDPLADTYNAMLHDRGITPFLRTRTAEAERLSSAGLGEFDLVFSCNALDHCYDPILAIGEMLAVTKPSGVVFFEGYVNEAINEHEAGLHQWNFMPIDTGDLVIWQRRAM
jgi:hypothetical protein